MNVAAFDTTVRFGEEDLHITGDINFLTMKGVTSRTIRVRKIYLLPFDYDITKLCTITLGGNWNDLIQSVVDAIDNPITDEDDEE